MLYSQILCTKHPEFFQWIKTTKEDFKTLINDYLVLGGYEPNNKIYVGRKQIDDVVVVGKIQVSLPDLNAIFHYIYEGNVFFSYSFEVLSYF